MAKRRGRKMTKMKAHDTHRFLRFVLTHTGTNEDFHYLDLSKILSQINRRLYRQGGTYHVANITVHDSAGDAYVKFAGLPDTWYTQAAWKMGFEAWKTQRAIAQSSGTSLSGRYSDFKVFLNDDARTDVDQLAFKDIENGGILTGDWDYSKFYIQDDDGDGVDEMFIHMMGANNGDPNTGSATSVSLLGNFSKVIATSNQEPNIPDNADGSIFTLLAGGPGGSEVVKEIVNDLESENDLPPYNAEIGGAGSNCANPWEYREVSIKSSQSPSAMIPGFPLPLGLLCIESKSSTNGNEIGVLLELVPGTYKGVAFDSWA